MIAVDLPYYFLYSLCDRIYHRIPTNFEAGATLTIRSATKFNHRLISLSLTQYLDWEPMAGPVTHYDPYLNYTKFRESADMPWV